MSHEFRNSYCTSNCTSKKNQLANKMLISTNMHLLKGQNKITEQFVSHLTVGAVSPAMDFFDPIAT